MPPRSLTGASQVHRVQRLGPLEGAHHELQDTLSTFVAVDAGLEKVLRRAAQVPPGDERYVDARARDHHVRPGSVYASYLPAPVRGLDDIYVGAQGLELGGQEPLVQPRGADLQHHGPCVGQKAGERYLEARVAGE